jgi:hypothetical protein
LADEVVPTMFTWTKEQLKLLTASLTYESVTTESSGALSGISFAMDWSSVTKRALLDIANASRYASVV